MSRAYPTRRPGEGRDPYRGIYREQAVVVPSEAQLPAFANPNPVAMGPGVRRAGELAHRMAVAIGENLEDAPLLDGHAFLAQPQFQLPVDLPVGLREQISEVFGDRSVRFCHG